MRVCVCQCVCHALNSSVDYMCVCEVCEARASSCPCTRLSNTCTHAFQTSKHASMIFLFSLSLSDMRSSCYNEVITMTGLSKRSPDTLDTEVGTFTEGERSRPRLCGRQELSETVYGDRC